VIVLHLCVVVLALCALRLYLLELGRPKGRR
jgi:hypothetical protein